jgi:BirA family biotin operon repressor/biotin-[acetyl-CoA-carboxylase] ligase
MKPQFTFHTLDTVDSTNNYAMGLLREGLAEHGDCWFANKQTSGRGQQGKTWISQPGENITMSVVISPGNRFGQEPFIFNMLIALICRDFLLGLISEKINIKWPNDIYVNDRKAGGLLIENIYRGQHWIWSVVGIGINMNQLIFEGIDNAPISLRMITDKKYDTEEMAKVLHKQLVLAIEESTANKDCILSNYNKHLYKIGNEVEMDKDGSRLMTKILGVNSNGMLQTEAGDFRNGEIAMRL